MVDCTVVRVWALHGVRVEHVSEDGDECAGYVLGVADHGLGSRRRMESVEVVRLRARRLVSITL